MTNSVPLHSTEKKDFLFSYLVNPETYFWLAILLFCTVTAGWFLVGVGAVFALFPFFGLAAYRFLRNRKGK